MTRAPYLLPAAALALLITGCHVDTHKNGNNDNVSISTPFGGMHVDTHGDTDTSSIGLSTYPGATPLQDKDSHDRNSANVDMSFGDFHLGVKATNFQTTDAPDKVLSFYRKDLAKYGDVITCQHDAPIGTPARTSQGLTCSSDKDDSGSKEGFHLHGTINNSDIAEGKNLELRAGSKQHQHIVAVEKKDGYTKIGLVLLDLPSHLDSHNGKEVE